MKILVCIKQVPASSNVEVDPITGVLKRNGNDVKMNPYDLYALECALQLSERFGGEVSAITMGPPAAQSVIMEAVCMGAVGGCVLSDRKFAGADVLATAYTLSQGIEAMDDFDIIFCGKQTTDGDTSQVGAEMAEFLGLPHVANVEEIIDVKDARATVRVRQGQMRITETVPLPCVMCTDAEINTPRLPSYKRSREVGDDCIVIKTFADFKDRDENNYGLNGSATQVERIFPPDKNTEKMEILGTAQEQAQQLKSIMLKKKFI